MQDRLVPQESSTTNASFVRFGEALGHLQTRIISRPIGQVTQMDIGDVMGLYVNLPPEMSDTIKNVIGKATSEYISQEKKISQWWNQEKLDHASPHQIDQLLLWANRGHHFTVREGEPLPEVQRTRLGFALKLTDQQWLRLIKPRIESGSGNRILTEQELKNFKALGCVLSAKELADAGLPPELSNLKIIAVVNGPKAQQIIEHEEGEVVGLELDRAISENPVLGRYRRRYLDVDLAAVTPLHDIAAKIELGDAIDFTGLGITREWIAANHQEEAQILMDIIEYTNSRVAAIYKMPREQQEHERQQLANMIRGGILNPTNLHSLILSEGRNEIPLVQHLVGFMPEDAEVMTADRDVRFFYSEVGSLKIGSQIKNELDGIVYTVEGVPDGKGGTRKFLGRGANRIVYKALGENGVEVAILEHVAPVAEALLATKFGAAALVQDMAASGMTSDLIVDRLIEMAGTGPFKVGLQDALIKRIESYLTAEQLPVDRFLQKFDGMTSQRVIKLKNIDQFPSAKLPDLNAMITAATRNFVDENQALIRKMLAEGAQGHKLHSTEAQTLSKVEHLPGFPKFYGTEEPIIPNRFDPQHRAFYIIEQYIPGPTLADLWCWNEGDRPALQDPEYIRTVFVEIADKLHPAHDLGVVHKDLKFQNLKKNAEGIWILDLGNAKVRSEYVNLASAGQNRSGGTMAFGTAYTASPDFFTQKGTDRRSDVYSLGKMMASAITGKEYLDPASPMNGIPITAADNAKVQAHMRSDLVARGTPEDLIDAIMKATNFEPKDRFQTAQALSLDLSGHTKSEPDPVFDPAFAELRTKPGARIIELSNLVNRMLSPAFVNAAQAIPPDVQMAEKVFLHMRDLALASYANQDLTKGAAREALAEMSIAVRIGLQNDATILTDRILNIYQRTLVAAEAGDKLHEDYAHSERMAFFKGLENIALRQPNRIPAFFERCLYLKDHLRDFPESRILYTLNNLISNGLAAGATIDAALLDKYEETVRGSDYYNDDFSGRGTTQMVPKSLGEYLKLLNGLAVREPLRRSEIEQRMHAFTRAKHWSNDRVQREVENYIYVEYNIRP